MSGLRLLRFAAWLWLALSLLLGGLGLLRFEDWRARVDSDLFALLPRDARDARAEAVLERLARQGERQLVLMVSGADRAEVHTAARTLRQDLQGLGLDEQVSDLDPAALRDWFKPFRAGLAARTDLAALQFEPVPAWTARAAALAFTPVSPSGLPWQDDPYGLFGNWLLERAGSSPARPVDGLLEAQHDGQTHVILNYRVGDSVFSLAVQERIDTAVGAAIAGLRTAHPQLSVQRAGVLVHAAAAARAAQAELNLIGNGSTLGVILLTLLSFRGWRALPLMLLPVLMGSLWAVGASFLLFERVHLLTLVFGASLIGVAVDYAEHSLGSSIDSPMPPPERYRKLLPGMVLALLTTVVGYLGLLLTPFPGLAQMAMFAAIGICAAWLSVMLWYPFIAPPSLRAGPAAAWLLRAPQRYPRWPGGWRGAVLGLAAAAVCALGIGHLKIDDDIRNLVSTRPELVAEQAAVSRVLGLPSPAQFFLVSGPDEQAVLAREAALTTRLRNEIQAGSLTGYQALSDWLIPLAQQGPLIEANQRLLSGDALVALRQALDLEGDWQATPAGARKLTLADLRASPLAPLLDSLWLGRTADKEYASVVLLNGLHDRNAAARLASLADGQHVRWVDKPARISLLFGEYRQRLLWLCALAFAAAVPLLWWRFRHDSLRVLAPVLLACGATLALMGALGMPLQLLNVLALLVILGMGVDYGIFIVESEGDPRSFVATLLAASTTVLSFGLLAFSSTPALHSFGFAIFCGVALSALLAPLFRHAEAAP